MEVAVTKAKELFPLFNRDDSLARFKNELKRTYILFCPLTSEISLR